VPFLRYELIIPRKRV